MSEWTKIDAETRAEWRVDAGRRGGVPQPGDADPYTRYQANRITRLLDALDALDDAAERERLREAVIVLAAAACACEGMGACFACQTADAALATPPSSVAAGQGEVDRRG